MADVLRRDLGDRATRGGEATMSVGYERGHVVIRFPDPVRFIALTRAEAEMLSAALADYAKRIDRGIIVQRIVS